MKAALFLLLGLGAASTFACDAYSFCWCTNADGSHNDNATTKACGNFKDGAMVLDPDPDFNWVMCASTTGSGWDNCCFRRVCQDSGAAGDSECGGPMKGNVPCPI
jgi:hypothetical protein